MPYSNKKKYWVLPRTDIVYEGNIPEEAYSRNCEFNSKTKDIQFINFRDQDDVDIRLERISEFALKQRRQHWVYPGTNIEYTGKIPVQAFSENTEFDNKTNRLKSITFKSPDGTQIQLESVTHAALMKRKRSWVYPGTDKLYEGEIPPEALLNGVYDKKNILKFIIFLTADGLELKLESISETALKSRKERWVYPGTNILYEKELPPEGFFEEVEYDGNQEKKYINFKDENKHVRLERITETARIGRKQHWVFPGTGIVYEGKIPNSAFIENTELDLKTKLPKFINFKDSEEFPVRLESISENTLRDREQCWVYPGTDIIYKGEIPIEAFHNHAEMGPESKKLKFLKFTDSDGLAVSVENISKSALKQRARHWVYSKTNIKYEGEIPLSALINGVEHDSKTNLVKFINFRNDAGDEIRLELISNNAIKTRRQHWVFPGTNVLYEDEIPADEFLLNVEHDKNKNIKFINFIRQESLIRLESISESALKTRKRIWVLPGTDIKYQDDIPLEAFLKDVEYDKAERIKFVNFTLNGSSVRLESISETGAKNRKQHWVYPKTEVKYDGDIPLEAFSKDTERDKKTNRIRFINFTDSLGRKVRLEAAPASTLRARARSVFKDIDDPTSPTYEIDKSPYIVTQYKSFLERTNTESEEPPLKMRKIQGP